MESKLGFHSNSCFSSPGTTHVMPGTEQSCVHLASSEAVGNRPTRPTSNARTMLRILPPQGKRLQQLRLSRLTFMIASNRFSADSIWISRGVEGGQFLFDGLRLCSGNARNLSRDPNRLRRKQICLSQAREAI